MDKINKLFKIIPFVFIFGLSLLAIGKLTAKNHIGENQTIKIGIHYLTKDNLLLADEAGHYEQIIALTKSFPFVDFNYHLSMTPGYEYTIALIIKLLKNSSPPVLRLAGLFLNFLLIPAVYLVAKNLDPKTAYLKTLECCFFPLFFPFFPLLYTDLFALTLVLFTFYFVKTQHYNLAGILGILSLLVRQTNIVWFPLFIFLMYVQDDDRMINLPNLLKLISKLSKSGKEWVTQAREPKRRCIVAWAVRAAGPSENKVLIPVLKHLKKGLIFYLGIVAFFVFVYFNHGIALGNKSMHPVTFPHLSNLYFSLFSFFILFLPINLAHFPKIVRLFSKYKLIFIILPLGFIIYAKTFSVTHPYNYIPHFIRNDILIFVMNNYSLKAALYITISYAILSLASMRLISPIYYAFYPFTLFSILSYWLIELRYYFVPFALFLLVRKHQSKRTEYLLLLFFIISSLLLFKGTFAGKFFI